MAWRRGCMAWRRGGVASSPAWRGDLCRTCFGRVCFGNTGLHGVASGPKALHGCMAWRRGLHGVAAWPKALHGCMAWRRGCMAWRRGCMAWRRGCMAWWRGLKPCVAWRSWSVVFRAWPKSVVSVRVCGGLRLSARKSAGPVRRFTTECVRQLMCLCRARRRAGRRVAAPLLWSKHVFCLSVAARRARPVPRPCVR
jgi:hypothetical protein